MAATLESTILTVSIATCAGVFAVALFFFARDVFAAKRLSQRANAMVPQQLLSQMRFAQLDAKRTATTFKELSKVAPRAAIASASILHSIGIYRALLARLLDLA